MYPESTAATGEKSADIRSCLGRATRVAAGDAHVFFYVYESGGTNAERRYNREARYFCLSIFVYFLFLCLLALRY